jgi:hypothetical protein
MTAAGKRIWRQIVRSKPTDWFDDATLEVLYVHAENLASAQTVSRDLRKVKPGSLEFRAISGDMKTLTSALAVTGRQLRLTVLVDVQGQKAGERQVTAASDSLVGGNATRQKVRIIG